MFARMVTIPLKPGRALEYAKIVEKDAIPLLRRHKGFMDEINLVTADGKTGFGISFWDSKETVEAFTRSGSSEVLKTLDAVVTGPPQVQICEVTNSTAHKIAAALAA